MAVDIWVKECVCVCRQWRGGEMFANVCVCVLVNLNLKVETHVYLHVHRPEEHCSITQCAPLTFQLHLSACTKAFLQALTCVNLLLAIRDSRVQFRTCVGGQHA